MTSTEAPTTGISIYLAFAREDQAIKEKLEKQLSSLKHTHRITCWHRYLVPVGKEPRREIEEHLQCAGVILLLISPNFLASGEWYELEIAVAMQKSEADKARVVPIIIRPTYGWQEEPFGELQVLPRNVEHGDTRALHDRDYKKIAEEIGDIIKTLQPERSIHSSLITTGSLPRALSPMIQRRSKVVQQIYKRLIHSDTTALVLTGIGGAGKSTLANLVYHYAKKQFEAGEGLFTAEPIWLEINPSFTMDDLITRVFNALGKPRTDHKKLLPQEQAEMLFKMLDMVNPRLVILDQFEHFLDAQTREASPEHPGVREWLTMLNDNICACRMLLTSRLKPDIPDVWHIQDFSVPDLDITEGVTFLRKSLQVRSIKPPEDELQTAVERCKGHPLSLRLLASLLKEYNNLNLNTLLYDPLYAEYWKGAIASKLLDLIYQPQLDQKQRHLLLAFSVFREPVPLEAAEKIMEIFDAATIPTKRLLPVLATLRNLHLLEDASLLRCYQLHPIVASYARDHFDEKSEQANHLALLAAHVKAAEFYQQQAEKAGSPWEQRKNLVDFHDFVEVAWHWCQAKRQEMAYELICQEGLFAGLQRCGNNTTLFELYDGLFPLEMWHPEPLQAAQIYNEHGEIQRTLGQKREAQSSLMKALSLFQELGNPEGQVKTLNNLGAVYRISGLLESALSCYQEALQICNTMESAYLHGKATSLNNIGVISLYLGQIERALEFFEQALLVQRTIQDQSEEARTLMNMGRVYDIQKKSDEAYQRYQEALSIFREIGDREGLAAVYNQLGIYYTKKPEKTPEKKRALRQEAEKQHMLALRIFQEIGDREQEAITLQRLGRLSFYYYVIDNNSRAKEDFEKPLAFYLHGGQICQELQMPEKGEIPRLVIDELQSRLGAEQLAKLIAEIEPYARQIVGQVLRRGYLLIF